MKIPRNGRYLEAAYSNIQERTMIDNMKIASVFPRKTSATPDDSLVFINRSPPYILPDILYFYCSKNTRNRI